MQPTEQIGRPHRNHGLFSDHYLNVTLPGRPDWRSLAGEARGALEEISRILDAYAPSQNEAQTEEDLVRPVLRALGHDFEVQPALATPEGTKRPDYVFYRDAASRDASKRSASAARGERTASRPLPCATSVPATKKGRPRSARPAPRPPVWNAASPTS